MKKLKYFYWLVVIFAITIFTFSCFTEEISPPSNFFYNPAIGLATVSITGSSVAPTYTPGEGENIFSLEMAPNWVTIDETTGVLTWTPTTASSNYIKVVVANTAGSTSAHYVLIDSMEDASTTSNVFSISNVSYISNENGNPLTNLIDMLVSHDGTHLYVTSGNGTFIDYDIDTQTGVLTYSTNYTDKSFMPSPQNMVESPTGDFIYVTSDGGGITQLFKNPVNGELSRKKRIWIGNKSQGITIKNSGAFVYALLPKKNNSSINIYTSTLNSTTTINNYNVLLNPGQLKMHPEDSHMFSISPTLGIFVSIKINDNDTIERHTNLHETNGFLGLTGAVNFAISSDGNNIYVAGSDQDTITIINFDNNTGIFTPGTNMVNNQNNVINMNQPYDVEVSPDGQYVFVSTLADNSLVVFRRNITTGALIFLTSLQHPLLASPKALAISPINPFIYVAGENGPILVYKLD